LFNKKSNKIKNKFVFRFSSVDGGSAPNSHCQQPTPLKKKNRTVADLRSAAEPHLSCVHVISSSSRVCAVRLKKTVCMFPEV